MSKPVAAGTPKTGPPKVPPGPSPGPPPPSQGPPPPVPANPGDVALSKRTILDSYIVTLKQGLSEAQRDAHMKFVHQQCERQTVPSTREPAQVTNIVRYPCDPTKPAKIFIYFGKFSKTIADKIADQKTEVDDIHLDRIGKWAGAVDKKSLESSSSARNWGLEAISSDPAHPGTTLSKYFFENDETTRLETSFSYNAPSKLGQGATIFVLDSGFAQEAQSSEKYGFDPTFIDTTQYQAKLPQKALSQKRSAQDIIDACKGHIANDPDLDNFHGTNVSRYAASWLYGAAPAARVINIGAAVTDKDGTGLVESKIILAFQIILAHFETGECTSGKTIVNFSWTLGMADVKDTSSTGIVQQSRTLLLEGAFLVAAAGNDSKVLRKTPDGWTAGLEQAADLLSYGKEGVLYVAKHFPMCVPGITLVGYSSYDGTPNKSSRRPYPNAEKAPSNLFIWAPGTAFPAWHPAAPPNGKIYDSFISGSSFAAPLFCGALACIVSQKDSQKIPIDPSKTQDVIQEYLIIVPGQNEMKLLCWWGK